MFKNRFVLISVFSLYLLSFLFFCRQESFTYARQLSTQVLRFHVIANSNSADDQKTKLQLKSYLVETLRPYLENSENINQAKNWIINHCYFIQHLALAYLKEKNNSLPVNVNFTNCYFPIKTYGNYSFPAGFYDALEIKLGTAKGRNWWCVLYPSLCFHDETLASFNEDSSKILKSSLTNDEYQTISHPLNLRFKLAEIIENTIH